MKILLDTDIGSDIDDYNARPPVHRSGGLDVTLQVQMAAAEVRRRFQAPRLRPVLDMAEVWFAERPEVTFHDPLAAVSICRRLDLPPSRFAAVSICRSLDLSPSRFVAVSICRRLDL